MNRPLRPKDRNIDIRMRALGVFGFLLLAGVFFSIGVFCIGPRLRSSREEVQPPQSTRVYTPPQERRPVVEEEQAKEKGPDIKLEITESGEDDVPAAEEFADSGQSEETTDVKADENGLTIRLDDRDKHSTDKTGDARVPGAVEPKRPTPTSAPKSSSTAKPTSSQTKSGGGSDLAKPRAATEKRDVMYRVQAGTYGNKSSADNLAAKLRNDGYRHTRVATVQTKDRTLYRVEVAEYKTREDAEELFRDLGATGYTPAVVERPK